MTFIDLKLDERQFLMLVVVIALFLRGCQGSRLRDLRA